MLCELHDWWDLQFQVDCPNDRFLRKFSWHFYLLSKFLPEICWEQVAKEIFFHISFWCLGLDPGLTCNKPTHYQIDHGDFNRADISSKMHFQLLPTSRCKPQEKIPFIYVFIRIMFFVLLLSVLLLLWLCDKILPF